MNKLSLYLYNLFILLLQGAIQLAAFFNPKAKLWVAGRKNWLSKMTRIVQPKKGKCVWIHCASLGEFEQGRPLIEALKKQYPSLVIVLTFYSPSGYEVRKKYSYANYVFYLPLDTKKNAQLFIELIQPDIAIFVKYEFWYHYIKELKQRAIPAIGVSVILKKNYPYFKWYGGIFRQMLQKMHHLFVQNNASKQLLESINITHQSIASDTRFDRVLANSKQVKNIPIVQQFKGNNLLMVVGSSWPNDDKIIGAFINQSPKNMQFIIAPHELKNKQIAQIQASINYPSVRYSDLSENKLITEKKLANYKVLIIDNIGMLSSIYAYADYAYIGGGFGSGIHNILEASIFGIPIFFGPKHQQFQEALDLIELGSAFCIKETSTLIMQFNALYYHKAAYQKAAAISKKYTLNNTGGTAIIMAYLQNYLNE